MTKDELVEELLPITRDFINQKRLSDAGCRTMLRTLLTKIELSKLHQPTVSVEAKNDAGMEGHENGCTCWMCNDLRGTKFA